MATWKQGMPKAIIGLLGVFCLAAAAPASAETIEEKAEVCGECHGKQGIPPDKTMPIIWGQHVGYTYLQLRDYKSGARKNETMQAIVADLERDDMLALAEYFAKKPWPRNAQPPARPEVAVRAAAANVSVGCTGCHQASYIGEGTQPRIAGQLKDYLGSTMLAIRKGERANNPGMTTLMAATSEQDIAALAEYLAGL